MKAVRGTFCRRRLCRKMAQMCQIWILCLTLVIFNCITLTVVEKTPLYDEVCEISEVFFFLTVLGWVARTENFCWCKCSRNSMRQRRCKFFFLGHCIVKFWKMFVVLWKKFWKNNVKYVKMLFFVCFLLCFLLNLLEIVVSFLY